MDTKEQALKMALEKIKGEAGPDITHKLWDCEDHWVIDVEKGSEQFSIDFPYAIPPHIPAKKVIVEGWNAGDPDRKTIGYSLGRLDDNGKLEMASCTFDRIYLAVDTWREVQTGGEMVNTRKNCMGCELFIPDTSVVECQTCQTTKPSNFEAKNAKTD